MEVKAKFIFKVVFEKMLALGIGYDKQTGFIILLPFLVIGIGFKRYEPFDD